MTIKLAAAFLLASVWMTLITKGFSASITSVSCDADAVTISVTATGTAGGLVYLVDVCDTTAQTFTSSPQTFTFSCGDSNDVFTFGTEFTVVAQDSASSTDSSTAVVVKHTCNYQSTVTPGTTVTVAIDEGTTLSSLTSVSATMALKDSTGTNVITKATLGETVTVEIVLASANQGYFDIYNPDCSLGGITFSTDGCIASPYGVSNFLAGDTITGKILAFRTTSTSVEINQVITCVVDVCVPPCTPATCNKRKRRQAEASDGNLRNNTLTVSQNLKIYASTDSAVLAESEAYCEALHADDLCVQSKGFFSLAALLLVALALATFAACWMFIKGKQLRKRKNERMIEGSTSSCSKSPCFTNPAF